VGPLTIAMLMSNTVKAARMRAETDGRLPRDTGNAKIPVAATAKH
jgi:hypothetical protein